MTVLSPLQLLRALVLLPGLWSEQAGLPSPVPAMTPPGIYLQAHQPDLRWPVLHLCVRITPSAQERWHRARPDLFRQQDANGRWFTTLGAGNEGDKLLPDFNRPRDVDQEKRWSLALGFGPKVGEDLAIERLLCAAENAPRDLPFDTTAENGGKNCNSFVAGVLNASGAVWPELAKSRRVWGAQYPVSVQGL